MRDGNEGMSAAHLTLFARGCVASVGAGVQQVLCIECRRRNEGCGMSDVEGGMGDERWETRD